MQQIQLKSEAVEALLKESTRIPSLPAIAVRILEIVKEEDFSLGKLAEIIEADPALRQACSGWQTPRSILCQAP